MTLTIDHAMRAHGLLKDAARSRIRSYLDRPHRHRRDWLGQHLLKSAKLIGDSIRQFRAGIEDDCPDLKRGGYR